MFQRVHPDDRDRVRAEVRARGGREKRLSIGFRIVLPDGTVKHLEIHPPTCVLRKRGTGRDCRYTDRRDGTQARRGSTAGERRRSFATTPRPPPIGFGKIGIRTTNSTLLTESCVWVRNSATATRPGVSGITLSDLETSRRNGGCLRQLLDLRRGSRSATSYILLGASVSGVNVKPAASQCLTPTENSWLSRHRLRS